MNKLGELDKNMYISEKSRDYKKFKILDPTGCTTNDPIISLVINKNNFMYGVDDYLNFYFGRIDENFIISLLRFKNTDNGTLKTGIGGFLKYEKRCIKGSLSTRFRVLELDDFYNYIENNECSGELFNVIEDENIPNFEVLISAAYSACCKNNSHFPEHIAYFQEKFDKENHNIARVRKI